jgi:hypothetical protein
MTFHQLLEAIKPFADYADTRAFETMPDDFKITQGSSLARKQITAGDFKKLLRAYKEFKNGNVFEDKN